MVLMLDEFVESVPITTNIVSFNPAQARGTRYNNMRYKAYQSLAAGRWFSPCVPVSSTNETVRHDITEISLKVALNTIIINLFLLLYNFCRGKRGLVYFFA